MTSHYNQADHNLYHAIHSDVVGELLHPPRAPSTPEPVRRFRRAHYADPGTRTFHWGVAADPNDKPNQIHGTKFGTKALAPEVVNPPVAPAPHRQLTAERRLMYDSSQRRPVGTVPVRQDAIPVGLADTGVTFGVPTKYGVTVADCISPALTKAQFQALWCQGTDLYRRTHQHYNPGEQVRRCYGNGYDESAPMGVPTPHDETGRRARECVTWPGPCAPLPPVVSARAEDWREINQDTIGQSLDKFQCTRDLPADFTYGRPFRHKLAGALDVTAARTRCCMPADDLVKLDLILVTRRRLQTAGFSAFVGLMHTLKAMDKLGTKRLPLEAVLAACCQMCVPLSEAELRQLVLRLGLVSGPKQLVIYSLFVGTINWKDRLTMGHLELLRGRSRPLKQCQTTNQCVLRPPPIDWTVEHKHGQGPGEPPQKDEGPRRDRVVDVVRPTPFTELGLRETELTKPRTEAFLLELTCGMGVCDYDQFKALYAAAKRRHTTNPSVLDIVAEANRACNEAADQHTCGDETRQTRNEAPAETGDASCELPPPGQPVATALCPAGSQEVRTVAESRTCRGTDEIAFMAPSLAGEKKVKFAESALESCGNQLPRSDPACATDFQPPFREVPRQPCHPPATSCECPQQPAAPGTLLVGCPAAPDCPSGQANQAA